MDPNAHQMNPIPSANKDAEDTAGTHLEEEAAVPGRTSAVEEDQPDSPAARQTEADKAARLGRRRRRTAAVAGPSNQPEEQAGPAQRQPGEAHKTH